MGDLQTGGTCNGKRAGDQRKPGGNVQGAPDGHCARRVPSVLRVNVACR